MPLNINGTTIQTSNSALSITTNSVTGFDINSSNFPVLSTRPSFSAQGTVNAAVALANASWTTIVFDTTNGNIGSNYSTSTGIFTAPVSGVYYFEAHLYGQKANDTTASTYTHPVFIINGSFTYRQAQAIADAAYRLRSRTYYNGAYSWDTIINDVFYLAAGDNVRYYVYASSGLVYVPVYSLFSGFLIG
jgi:hypothetical protein